MGLNTTHGCWDGAYSAFHRWRVKLAEVEGIPLELMEGFGWPLYQTPSEVKHNLDNTINSPVIRIIEIIESVAPIKWDLLKPDPLHFLLHHSDCDGEIPVELLEPIAQRLEEVLPKLPNEDAGGHIGNWHEKTQKFIDGLRLAASLNEPVIFM